MPTKKKPDSKSKDTGQQGDAEQDTKAARVDRRRAQVSEHRKTAEFVQNTFREKLEGYSDASSTPVVGGAQYFPRSTSGGRTAERVTHVLRRDADELVAVLHALADAEERESPAPAALEVFLQVRGKPYIQALRALLTRKPQESSKGAR